MCVCVCGRLLYIERSWKKANIFLPAPPPSTGAQQSSTSALRGMSNDETTCRRKALLDYFGETSSYTQCGNCDNCDASKKHGDDLTRDFRHEAALILTAVSLHGSLAPAKSKLQTTLASDPRLEGLRGRVPKDRRSASYLLESFLGPLVKEGYVQRGIERGREGERVMHQVSPLVASCVRLLLLLLLN